MTAEIPGQVLTFVLGTEHYGVDILRVQEIRGWAAITKIPHAPAHVLGVLNLRGTIVPVVDLRMRFNLDHAAYTPTTVIIVLALVVSGSTRHVGVVVDAVSDVRDVNADDVRPAPELSGCTATDYMIGILTSGTQMTMLLEIDRLIGGDIACLSRSAA
ncbi:MAG TPA: chemotaxis protein CheW [Steroidobacteraceae bacterium]